MRPIVYILIFCLLYINTNIFAQEPRNNQLIENLIEELSESADAEIDFSVLYEDLLYYLENPIDLNKATRDDLEKLQFLNDFQIEGILKYQRVIGQFHTLYELQLVQGFSKTDIFRILPFIKVEAKKTDSTPDIKRVLSFGKHKLFLRTQSVIEEPAGYSDLSDKRYDGNRLRYYTKYQFSYKKNVNAGFTMEKDPGEAFWTDSLPKGFDYYTAHVEIRNIGMFKTINIGDYQAKFGQGLTTWTGYGSGKSSYISDIRKKHDGLRKYSSSDENLFLRGAGTTLRFRDFELSVFGSYKNIDGNIDTTEYEDEAIATSYQTTGLHNTYSTRQDRKTVSELIYGGNLTYRYSNFRVGATYFSYQFGVPLQKDERVYSHYDFTGDKNANYSIDYQYSWHNFYFFGEGATSELGGYAILNSALVSVAPQLSFAMLHRHYTPDYHAYYAAGFGEKSKTNNENGLYIGAEIYPLSTWKVSVYYDSYRFPWMLYRTHAPSTGADYFVQADYSPARYVEMYFRYKTESAMENQSDESVGIEDLAILKKQMFRYHVSYGVSKNLTLKSRIEFAKYKKTNLEDETGFLMYQDIEYRTPTLPLNVSFRFALFDSDYNARSYAYESDILYAFSVPSYSGRGIRSYLTVKYTIVEDLMDIWLRYGIFHYTDREIIGTGLDEISGRNKSEAKIQIRIKL